MSNLFRGRWRVPAQHCAQADRDSGQRACEPLQHCRDSRARVGEARNVEAGGGVKAASVFFLGQARGPAQAALRHVRAGGQQPHPEQPGPREALGRRD